MSTITQYMDIGHADPKDIIWIFRDLQIEKVMAGQTLTHGRLWGEEEIKNHWRGRYERKTGYCSIVAPVGELVKRPHRPLLEELKLNFHIVRFYFFADGIESFSPNPKKGNGSGDPV